MISSQSRGGSSTRICAVWWSRSPTPKPRNAGLECIGRASGSAVCKALLMDPPETSGDVPCRGVLRTAAPRTCDRTRRSTAWLLRTELDTHQRLGTSACRMIPGTACGVQSFLIEPREHRRRPNDCRCADQSESRPACQPGAPCVAQSAYKLLIAKVYAS